PKLAGRIHASGTTRDKVVHAQRFDLLQRITGRAFADRHHGDDGCDPKDDAEDAQCGSEAIAAERFEREADVFRKITAHSDSEPEASAVDSERWLLTPDGSNSGVRLRAGRCRFPPVDPSLSPPPPRA